MSRPATYHEAGVHIAAGDRAVQLMRAAVHSTHRPGVRSDIGGFAGLFELDVGRYRRPVLATSTDGVGTKLVLAQALDRHDTVGLDLVAMVVDDIVTCGAEPLFLTDYIACGRLVPERIATIVAGIARGCQIAGCALVGGETAEHPGVLRPDEYDLAGAGVGVAEADRLLGPHLVRAGDVALALAASGVHANGFSLIRHVLAGARLGLDLVFDELDGRSLGDELLTPTRIYARTCLDLAATVPVHAFAHITGGGLAANVARALPPGLGVQLERGSWPLPAIYRFIAERGHVPAEELEGTFNLGIGMVAVLPAEQADPAVRFLAGCGVAAWVLGPVQPGETRARLVGRHPD